MSSRQVPPAASRRTRASIFSASRVAALALADVDVLGDRLVQPQRAQRLEDQGQPGPARQPVRVRDHFHRVREQFVTLAQRL